MKVGIPRAMSTYEYEELYTKFFNLLGVEVVLSDKTDRKIVRDGIENSVDECCLASKIYMGHVKNLVDKMETENIDYIFVPRICTFNKIDTVCVKFYAMFDICKNIFDTKFLTVNIDYLKKETELTAFLKLGKALNKNTLQVLRAYLRAKKHYKNMNLVKLRAQKEYINISNVKNPKILIVSHSYISLDEYMGIPILNSLKKLGANIFYANINSSTLRPENNRFTNRVKNKLKNKSKNKAANGDMYKEISSTIYWKYSKNLLNGIIEHKDNVDGIVYMSAFPCGPDSLVNEISMRKVTSVPSLNLVLDEQEEGAGLYTRLESFIDVVEQNMKKNEEVAGNVRKVLLHE